METFAWSKPKPAVGYIEENNEAWTFQRRSEELLLWTKKFTRTGCLNEGIDIDYEEMEDKWQNENRFRNKEDEVTQLSGEINSEVSNSDI